MRDDSPAETLLFDVVDDHVHRVARVLPRAVAANAPVSVRESLYLACQAGDRSDSELRRLSKERMLTVMATADAKEGPRAFVEKRAPNWPGR